MTTPPDILRPRILPPARAVAATFLRIASAATWHATHPSRRERFVESAAPVPLERLEYVADDGWRAPLFVVRARPGGSGEPVVLLHALGVSVDAFRYGRGDTLVSRLYEAGLTTYLLGHRGDADAVPPRERAVFDVDDIAERDVPAALDAVAGDSGFPRAHVLGHGLGGQIGLIAAVRGVEMASLTTVAAPVRFAKPRSEARHAAIVAGLLPRHWSLPLQLAARGAALGYDGEGGSRVRGCLVHATADVSLGLLAQVGRWVRGGTLCDRTGLLDWSDLFSAQQVPLLDVGADPARMAASTWGGPAEALVVGDAGALDLLLADDVGAVWVDRWMAFLEAHRRQSWQR